MATYVKPQVLVFQEFEAVPTAITDPLRAFICGPHARLHRYAEDDEKALISLGDYSYASDEVYDWPEKVAGSKIDLAYTKLFIDDALLKFFEDLVGSDSTIAPVANKPSRIRSSSVSFADNGSYDRSATLLRDVKRGDSVYVRGSDGSDSYELWTYVKSLVGDTVAGSVAAVVNDSINKSSQTLGTSVDKIAGADNCITLTPHGSLYDGRADGDIDETYTIEVISGSIGGDFTTARLRITSASGNDDVASVAPELEGASTDIGTRGLTVEFNSTSAASCSSAAGVDEVSPIDLIPGQKWRVRVKQAFTPATATSGGTYTGTSDTTYVAEVIQGGAYADVAQIKVTTTTGIDVSGPHTVPASATAIAIGSKGVTITLTGGTGVSKGDKYYITVVADAEGPMRTLVLGHDLPEEIQDAADLDVKLFIKKDIQVGQNRLGYAPLTNWEASATQFTVNSGIIAYDEGWADDGELQPLDVEGGDLFVEYREWLSDFCSTIESLDDAALVAATFGVIHPDNPLAEGVFKALSNSNGTPVRFSAVCDPDDLESWSDVVELLIGRDDVYNVVPLTHDREVQDLFAAHVADTSTAEKGLWRGAIFNLLGISKKAIISDATSSDDEVVLATLADDPDSTGTQYTLMKITSGNAELEELGVRAGDVVRYLFTTDGFDSVEYTEFVIDSVVNETTVLLADGHTVPIGTPQKVEIWRNLRREEIKDDVKVRAGSFSSSRVCVIWPDSISSAGTTMEGYYLAAALAGLRSGVVPHQGLTNVEVSGFDDVSRTTDFFNNAQLDDLAGAGVWIVTQDQDGTVYSRHAVTTDNTDVNTREEMVRANVDAMSYVFLRNLKTFIGRTNVTPSTLTVIRVQLEATIEYLKSNGFTETLGSQLIDGEILQLRAHALLRDRVVAALSLTIPYPLNNLECHLVI